MIYYVLIEIFVFLMSFFCFKIKSKKFFFYISLLILVLFAGLRGNFTSDYDSYSSFFEIINRKYSLCQIWNGSFYQEKGFVYFNKIIGLIIDSPIAFMFIMSAVTITCFFYEFRSSSKYLWLTILLFISVGGYYESFNISRQIFAVSIVFVGSKFVYNKEFLKYAFTVIIASLFHQTSLLMIPFYFILTRKISKKNIGVLIIFGLTVSILLPNIINVIQNIFSKYEGYTYGMDGGSLNSIILPFALLLFVAYAILFKKTKFNIYLNQNGVMINAIILYLLFSFLGTKVQMVARLAPFFRAYAWLLIPNILYEYKNKKEKSIIIFIICILVILYPLVTLSGTGYDPYYFIWEGGS